MDSEPFSLSLYFVLAYFIASCFGIQTSRCRLHTKANAGKLVKNILASRAGVIFFVFQTNGSECSVRVTSSSARVWLAGRRPWLKKKNKKTWCLLCFFQPSPESVPYRVALKNHKILLSSTESKDSLEQQVSHFYSWESVFGSKLFVHWSSSWFSQLNDLDFVIKETEKIPFGLLVESLSFRC